MPPDYLEKLMMTPKTIQKIAFNLWAKIEKIIITGDSDALIQIIGIPCYTLEELSALEKWLGLTPAKDRSLTLDQSRNARKVYRYLLRYHWNAAVSNETILRFRTKRTAKKDYSKYFSDWNV